MKTEDKLVGKTNGTFSHIKIEFEDAHLIRGQPLLVLG